MAIQEIVIPWLDCGIKAFRYYTLGVIPAQAGIHAKDSKKVWIPASAGMTAFVDTAIKSRYDDGVFDDVESVYERSAFNINGISRC